LAADRRASGNKLYATAVFYDYSEGTQYVVCKIQNTTGDITVWGGTKIISDDTNTDTIYGQSVRAVAESESERDDVIFVYKEGIALKSQYMSNEQNKGIQVIDSSTSSGKAQFDLEHSIVMGEKRSFLIYVDSDGTIKWRERLSGHTTPWGVAVTLTNETENHGGVGITEQGSGILLNFWRESHFIKYRLHRCNPETWEPSLGANPSSFDVSTDAVINTETVYQIQNPDRVTVNAAIPMCWIGRIGSNDCEIGWGIPIPSPSHVYSREKKLNLPTDDSDLDILFVPSEYVDVANNDDIYVQQCGRDTLDPYAIFLWKNKHDNNTDIIVSTCVLKTSIAPSVSSVYLQIYNRTDGVWETLDSDSITAADTEFTLSGKKTTDLERYYDEDNWVAHRIYQKAET